MRIFLRLTDSMWHPNRQKMSQPRIKVVRGRTPTKTATEEASASGTASLLSASSLAAERLPHDERGLQQFLHNKIAVAKQASRRGLWFGGRLYNWLSGEDPDYVQLSGTHLEHALPFAGMDVPEIVVRSGQYLLRLDIAQQAVDALAEKNDAISQAD